MVMSLPQHTSDNINNTNRNYDYYPTAALY